MTALFEFLIHMIVSKFTGIPMEKINGETLIPSKLQEAVITQVIISAGVYLSLPCEEGLTVGQIVEEAKKSLT